MRPTRFKTAHDKNIQQQAGYLLKDPDCTMLQTAKDEYSAIRPAHEADIQLLQKAVYLRNTGLKLGMPSAKDGCQPTKFALSIDANSGLPCINVNKEQALRFLKREEMGITGVGKGWYSIRYNGLGLGWVKSLGSRVNNYLPKHWRIRMDING